MALTWGFHQGSRVGKLVATRCCKVFDCSKVFSKSLPLVCHESTLEVGKGCHGCLCMLCRPAKLALTFIQADVEDGTGGIK